MTFEDAIHAMRLGKKVKHPSLIDVWYTIEKDDHLYRNTLDSCVLEQNLTRADIMSDNWQVIMEKHIPTIDDIWSARNTIRSQIYDISKCFNYIGMTETSLDNLLAVKEKK